MILENKRIRIKTMDGEKFTGRFKILDNEHFIIKNNIIELSKIEILKKHPLIMSIIINGGLYYIGSGMVVLPLILYPFTQDASAFLYAIPGTGLIYAGAKSPNILKGYDKSKGWKYGIISVPDI